MHKNMHRALEYHIRIFNNKTARMNRAVNFIDQVIF